MDNGKLQVQFGFISEQGKRDENQDYAASYAGTDHERALRGAVAAVADGMGGGRDGRLAAELTIRSFFDAYFSMPETLGVERAAGRALSAINRWIHAQGESEADPMQMGTTFSALILRGRQAHVVHIGDSRIYRHRDGALRLLTKDHTLKHPDLKHVLYRAIGIEDALRLDYHAHSLRQHDRYLICSDGIYTALANKEINKLLAKRTSPQEGAQQLVDAAMEKGSQDNITALIVDVIDVPHVDQIELASVIESLPIKELPKSEQEIDGFKLKDIISDGRYSRLFLAEDLQEVRQVVMKFPHPRIASDTSYRHAFIREAWIAARVHSPWVGEIIELTPGRQSSLYSVMPYYEGQTLAVRLKQQPRIGLDKGVDIGIKLAKAIYALNRLRIIHRDIKPENIMLLSNGDIKLLDLGVAYLPDLKDLPSEEIPGTPSFMAPELFGGEQGDERTDVYALGVTLYAMFSTGHYPFGEIEVFSTPRFNKRITLSHYRPDLPAWLDTLITKATAVEKEERFADTVELAFELENGMAKGGRTDSQKLPLYHRNPTRFWQLVSLLLLILLITLLATQ